jgi:hypothetical protein
LKRKIYSNNYRAKDVKGLMAKIRKELKSTETTGIRKAMKKVPAKAKVRKAYRQVYFFWHLICIQFTFQKMKKVP